MRHRKKSARSIRSLLVGVIGDLFITAGVLVLLFLGWQLWWNDWVIATHQSSAATDQSRKWLPQTELPGESHAELSTFDSGLTSPVVMAPVSVGEKFAIFYVPRFGAITPHIIAEGIGVNVLNNSTTGVGHYPGTQMPGEIGNFAIAAHRSAYGGAMHLMNELQLNDPIYIQTQDGWYTYRFRDLQYVQPSGVEILEPVPTVPGVSATDRIITLTTCNPLYSTDERIVAYGIFESFKPAAAGPPVAIAEQVKNW